MSRQNGLSPNEQVSTVEENLPLRKWLYSWLLDPNIPNNLNRRFEAWTATLIILNLFALLFEHVPALYEPNARLFHLFDVFSVVVFTAEFLLRFYLAPEDREFASSRFPRLRYLRSPYALIDLAAIAPFYLSALMDVDLRVLRALRLLRIFKLFRVLIPAVREFRSLNAGRSFRQKVHALVWPGEYGGKLHHYIDLFLVVWVVVSVAAVVLESVESIHFLLNVEFVILDTIAVTIFTVEYLLRVYSAVEEPRFRHHILGRFDYARAPQAVIDFLAIVPFFLEALLHHLFDLRFLRIFRLMRLLKLTRYTGATNTLAVVIKREWPIMGGAAFVMLLLVVLTASLGFIFEHEAQPDKFENIPQAIYWAVITLASVGYGDISPVTPMGRFLTIILALLGIGIFAIPAALLSSAFSDQLRREREALQNELYEMLSDGKISAEERHLLSQEAKRLHLSEDELDEIISRAMHERAERDRIEGPSLESLQKDPELALERYRELMGKITQIARVADSERMAVLVADCDRATAIERDVWQRLTGRNVRN